MHHFVLGQQPHRAQYVDLAVPQIPFAEGDRRLHGDEAEHLEQMVLHHVLQGADPVVVAGPALQREALVPDDLHLGDMGAVPQGFQHPVGEPAAQHVLHRGHGQEVVHPEHRLLRHQFGQPCVQLACAVQVFAERLLQDDPAPGRQARRAQRGDHLWEERGRQRQIQRHRLGTVDERPDVLLVGDIGPSVVRRRHDRPPCLGREVTALPVEPAGDPLPEPLRGQFLAARPGQPEPLVEVPRGVQGGEGRHEEAPAEIPRRPQDDQTPDHRRLAALARWRFTPLAMMPM